MTWVFLGLGVALLALCCGDWAYHAVADTLSPPAAAGGEQLAAAPYDEVAFATYWDDEVTANTRSLVTRVEWSGGALTARTKLAGGPDDAGSAITICGALSGFWLHTGVDFQPVRVLDAKGKTLISRRRLSDLCA